MTPSKKYTLKDLAIGTVHLAIQTPETGGQGTIIGPEGGTLTASDGTILTIPPGALSRETVVAVAPVNEGDLRVAIPAGFQVLKAVNIDLTRVTLSLSAEIAFPLPAGVASDTQVLVAKILEVDGILKLQAVGVGQVSGALLTSRGTVSGVSLPGIVSGGTYVALRAATPVGFVAGTITDPGGEAKAGVVVASGTGLVDVSRSDGGYLLATAAGSATITATDRATGQGASQAVTVSSGTAIAQPLQVQVIPPTVVSVHPAAGATSVPVNTQVTLTFSQPIAKVSLTGSSHATGVVLSGPGGPVETTLTLSPLGMEVTLYPSKALASQTTYSLVASQAIQDTHGVPLPAPFTSQFTTANAPPPPPPAGNLTVSFPDEQGNVTVTATQGTAAPDNLVVVLNVSSGTVTSATVGANGAFTTSLFAMLGDELLVMLQDAAGNQTVVSPGPYRSADGQFVMTRSGGSLDTPEGINLTLAPSAVSQPVTMKVTVLTLDQVATVVPPGLQFQGGLKLDTQGATFKSGAKISLPIPSGVNIPAGAQPFLARLQMVNGQLTPVLVDTMRVVTGKLMTSSPPFPGVLKEGDYVALLPTNPYPAVVTGTVVRDGTTPPQPISGAILRVDGTEVVATTDDKGKYALELFPPDVTKPRTFNLVALDPASGAMRGATLTVPAWTVPGGGGSYTLDLILPSAGAGRDTVPPTIALTVDAPSLRGGRVAPGDTVTVTVKVTDEIGGRADTLTLTKNGTPLQIALSAPGAPVTTTFIPTTPWEVLTLVSTAQDTSGNVGRAEATIQVSGGGGGGGAEVPPPAPPDQPLRVLSIATFPPPGAAQVDIGTEVMLLFTQPVANASPDLVFMRETDLTAGSTRIIDADVQVDPSDGSLVRITPKSRLRYRATYAIVAKAGLQGAGGGALDQDYKSRFATLDLDGSKVSLADARDVVVLDQYAIALDRTEGLVTIDIRDPGKPAISEKTPVFSGPFAANQGFTLAPTFTYTNAAGETVTAPALVVVGWISLPQGGVRGLLRIFDASDPIHPRRIGSATIARCTTGVPTKVLVKGQYAVVASLLQGLVVVDLPKVIGGSLTDGERPPLPSSSGGIDYGTTLPVAGPIGMSFSEDTADSRCDPGQPKAVLGTWDASGQLRSPLALKVYREDALVADRTTGVYRVNLNSLPLLDGRQVTAGPALRLDVLLDVDVPATGGQTQTTDVVAFTEGNTVTLVDLSQGQTLGMATATGTVFGVLADSAGSRLFLATQKGVEAIDMAARNFLRSLGASVESGMRALAGWAQGVIGVTPAGAAVIQTDMCCILILVTVENNQHYAAQGQHGVLYFRSAEDPPMMPDVSLRAKLVDNTPQHRPLPLQGREFLLQWRVSFTYSVNVSPSTRSHAETFTWASDLVPLREAEESQKVKVLWEKFRSVQSGQPLPSAGGGELQVEAMLIRVAPPSVGREGAIYSKTLAPNDGLTQIRSGDSGPSPTYQDYARDRNRGVDMSPGSNTLRIEGQLAHAVSISPPNDQGKRAENPLTCDLATIRPIAQGETRQDAFKCDPALKDKLVAYLQNPEGAADTAQTVRLVLTDTSDPSDLGERIIYDNLFRLIAFVESGIRQFNDLTLLGPVATKAKAPKEAVWPILNAINSGDDRVTDGGYGIMQLTNPHPTYEQIWNYRKNIDEAIRRLANVMLPRARSRANALRALAGNPPVEVPAQLLRQEVYFRYNAGAFTTNSVLDRDPTYGFPIVTPNPYVAVLNTLENQLLGLRASPPSSAAWGSPDQ